MASFNANAAAEESTARQSGAADQAEDETLAELEPLEGRAAWLNVLASFFVHFVVFGSVYSFSLFVTVYADEFQVGRADVSFVYQLQVGLLMGFGYVAGRLADQRGTRPVVLFGTALIAAGMLLGSFATQFWQMVITHGLMNGIGISFVYWPAITVIPQWFDKRRALASGLAVLGSGVGNFVVGVTLEYMIRTEGFRFALRVNAAVTTAVLLVAAIPLHRRLPNVQNKGACDDRDVLKSRNFLVILIGAMFFQTGYNVPFAHLSPYIEDLGLDTTFAALAVGLVGVGSAAGRIIVGFLADKFGRIISFKACMLGTGITCSLWVLCTTEASIMVFAVAFGFFSGAFIALVGPVMAEFYGVHRLGTVMGYVAFGLVPGSFVGPFLGGYIYDETGNYRGSIIFTAVMVMISAVVVMFITDPPKAEPKVKSAGVEQTSEGAANVV